MIQRYDEKDIKNLKDWFRRNNVCFASNVLDWSPKSLFKKSYSLYEPLITN